MPASQMPDVRPEPGESPALAFALAQPAAIPGERPDAGYAVEVYQVFGEAVLAATLYAPGQPVAVGAPDTTADRTLLVAADRLPPGCGPRVDVIVPDAASPSGWAVRWGDGWAASRVRGGEATRLDVLPADLRTVDADGLHRVALAPEDQVILEIGTVTIVARPARPARIVPRPDVLRADPARTSLFAFVVSALALFGVAIGVVPPPPAQAQTLLADGHYDLRLLSPPPPPPPTATESPKQEASGSGGGEGPSRSSRKRGGGDGGTSRGLLDALERGPLANMLGDATLRGDVVDAVSGLVGTRATSNGPGLAGRGPIGTAGYEGFDGSGLRAGPGGPGGNGGDPWGDGKVRRKTEANDILTTSTPVTLGGIRADEVDRVVKRHLAQIRYCYQRELQKDPSLTGKLSVKFVIATDGSVSSASAALSTLNAPAVEACVTSRFLRMQFPEVKGGGVAVVKYPFVFAPG